MTFRTKCWACGSKKFQETVSREYCPDCGIECSYHGGGANEKYNAACERKWARELEKDETMFAREFEEEWGVPYIK